VSREEPRQCADCRSPWQESSADRQDSESTKRQTSALGSFRDKPAARPLAKLATKARRSLPASHCRRAKPAAKVARVAEKPSSTTVLRPVAVAPVARQNHRPSKKPGFYEAIAIYESGVRGLQRHYRRRQVFRQVLQRLQNRAHRTRRLYSDLR
jgi:hypothetical protein